MGRRNWIWDEVEGGRALFERKEDIWRDSSGNIKERDDTRSMEEIL